MERETDIGIVLRWQAHKIEVVTELSAAVEYGACRAWDHIQPEGVLSGMSRKMFWRTALSGKLYEMEGQSWREARRWETIAWKKA